MSGRVLAAAALLLSLQLLGPCRGAVADEATYQRLVERATRILREAEAHQGAGRRDVARSRARQAAALIGQADRLKPRDTRTAFLGVQAAVFGEDAAAARKWVTRYARRTPYGDRDPNLHYARAMIWLLLEGRPAEAEASMERMVQLTPGRRLTRPANVLFYRVLTARAAGLVDAGHVDEAVERFKRASQIARHLGDTSKEIAARANGAITLLETGRAADAGRLFARLHAQQPANPVFAYYLGRSLRFQERFSEALVPLQQAAAAVNTGGANGRYADLLRRAYLELGITFREAARREADPTEKARSGREARSAFGRFTALEPQTAEGWHRLGRLLAEDLGLPHEAIAPLERAHGLDPACDGALRLLIHIAGRHGPPEGVELDAWNRRRAAWERDLSAHADRWATERERRRRASATGSDGCP